MKTSDFNQYSTEAAEKWGNTAAYREYTEKTGTYTAEKWDAASAGMMKIFAEFADCMKAGKTPGSENAQELAGKLQKHITENYYNCTKEILAGLGQMYVCDDRFRENIDRYGEGTARFASDAIRVYCGRETV